MLSFCSSSCCLLPCFFFGLGALLVFGGWVFAAVLALILSVWVCGALLGLVAAPFVILADLFWLSNKRSLVFLSALADGNDP